MRRFVIGVEAGIDRLQAFVHRLEEGKTGEVVDHHLVVDVRDHIDIGGAATRQPSLGIFGRDPEQGKPAMPNPEIQCDVVQQEGRDGAASRVTLIRHVAFFVCRTEPVGGPRPEEGCDASPTLRQRHTAGEVAMRDLSERRA